MWFVADGSHARMNDSKSPVDCSKGRRKIVGTYKKVGWQSGDENCLLVAAKEGRKVVATYLSSLV